MYKFSSDLLSDDGSFVLPDFNAIAIIKDCVTLRMSSVSVKSIPETPSSICKSSVSIVASGFTHAACNQR